MPQHDLYHNTVKQALIKDGWIITDDPFIIEFKGLRLYADLGAERTFAAEKYGRRIITVSGHHSRYLSRLLSTDRN